MWQALSAGAVFVTLPAAQRALRAYGFIGGGGGAATAGGAAAAAATFAALVAGFHAGGVLRTSNRPSLNLLLSA